MAERPKRFANRDDPIPILSFFTPQDQGQDHGPGEHGNGKVSRQQPPQSSVRRTGSLEVPDRNIGTGEEGRSADEAEGGKKSWRHWSGSGGGIQDQLYKLLLQSVVSSEEMGSGSTSPNYRVGMKTERPGFSLPVMSTNFRRFNARIGVAFAFQNRLMKLFSWRRPTQTLSFLAVYSFVCLEPSVLPVLPIALYLFFIMVPSYQVRYPAAPTQQHNLSSSSESSSSSNIRQSHLTDSNIPSYSTSYFSNNFLDTSPESNASIDSTNDSHAHSQYQLPSQLPPSSSSSSPSKSQSQSQAQSPPLNPPPTIRPAPEISRDFFRNMRDLQNSMEDFSRLHDAITAVAMPLTNFSDEATSSALFVVLALLAVQLVAVGHLVPWRAILLVNGWVATGLAHPGVQAWLAGLLASATATATASTRTDTTTSTPATTSRATDAPPSILSLTAGLQNKMHALLSRCVADDIILLDTGSHANHTRDENSGTAVPTPTETYQVEIFEFQQQQQQSNDHASDADYRANNRTITYSPSIFSPSSCPPSHDYSSARFSSLSSIDAVLPPSGPYRWADDGWMLDFGTDGTDIGCHDDGGDDAYGYRKSNDVGDSLHENGWTIDLVDQPGANTNNNDNHVNNSDNNHVNNSVNNSVSNDTNTNTNVNKTKWRRRRWIRTVERIPHD